MPLITLTPFRVLSRGYYEYVMSTVPVGYWSLSEITGSDYAADNMGTYPGAYNGSPILEVPGLLLDGSTDTAMAGTLARGEMKVISGDLMTYPNAPFSLSLIVQMLNTTDYFQMIALMRSSTGSPLMLIFNQGHGDYSNIMVGGQNDWGRMETTIPQSAISGDVSHFVITFDGVDVLPSNYKFYHNGTEYPLVTANPFPAIGSPTGHEFPHHRQATNFDTFVDAALDEIAVHDRVLTPTEITEMYNISAGI